MKALDLVVFAAAAAIGATGALAGTAIGNVAKNPDQVKCKSHVVTGSLAQVTKECHTRSEWEQMAQAERNGARDFLNASIDPTRRIN